MKNTVKISGISLKGLIAGGLVAGAVGLGFGEGTYGSPSSGSPSRSGSGTEMSGADTGVGGGKAPEMAHTLPPNVAPGWKIRVCSEKTKAQTIDFRAYPADDKSASKAAKKTSEQASEPGAKPMGTGSGGEATTQDPSAASQADIQTTSWSQGQSSLITLPESLAGVEKIKIEAVPGQKDMKSEVCVLYNDHVAKKLSFDEKSEATVRMNETGTCGC